MTLNETWKKCMSMWRWIAKMKRTGDGRGVWKLKEAWMEKRGISGIELDCFFCGYQKTHKTKHRASTSNCFVCPGSKVDPEFDCYDEKYSWEDEPIAFYNKLVSLNRKRLKKK